ncbi:MAG: hypothetical protein WCC17_15800 [Candidatus Nitrosopolaris sp.]
MPPMNIPAEKPRIISIHFKIFFKVKAVAYLRLPAKGMILDNKTSLPTKAGSKY